MPEPSARPPEGEAEGAAPGGLAAIGLDIGGTHLRAARVGADGRVLAHLRRPCPRDADRVLRDALEMVDALRTPEVAAVGVGVPGRVDGRARRVLSGGYVDLSRLPFAQRVEAATGLPAAVENDAAMALLAEHAFGAARGHDHVVMLTVGTGVGGAILEGGRLLRGRRAAGQLGHLAVEPEGLPCLCGRRGCLETASSGPALARHLAEAGLPPGTRAEELLGRPEDAAARRVLGAWLLPLRRAVDSLVAAFDPDLVVLGGGLGAAAAAGLDLFPAAPSWYGAPVRAAGLVDDAGVVGAAVAGLRRAGERGRAAARRAVLVNGVPASGKSGVARALADALRWPLLALDTVKQPFLDELPPGDRTFNRTLGRASLRAIFDLVAEAPPGAGVVIDAWFGFQPPDLLAEGLRRAGIGPRAEVWCEAPPEEVGRRYAARAARRGPGHPGPDYVPELVALARRAEPTGQAPALRIDTTAPLDLAAALAWIEARLAEPEDARPERAGLEENS